MNVIERSVDVLVIGGGTAGPMAAVKARQAHPGLEVLLLEKANVKRSGAISMGMDGLNNAVVPGHATPEQYVREITAANDGIVNQATLLAYARASFPMIEELDRWGVKFEKDETGDYAMLLERPDDVGVLAGAAGRQGPRVPEARPPGRGDDLDDRDHPAQQ